MGIEHVLYTISKLSKHFEKNVINQNNILHVLINTLEEHLPYWNFNAIYEYEFLRQFASKIIILFFQKMC